MRMLVIAALFLPLASGGCVRTAVGLATAPVKATSWTVNRLTTSQAEADRNRGRKLRKAEAREGRERRTLLKRCRSTPDVPECRDQTGLRAGQTN